MQPSISLGFLLVQDIESRERFYLTRNAVRIAIRITGPYGTLCFNFSLVGNAATVGCEKVARRWVYSWRRAYINLGVSFYFASPDFLLREYANFLLFNFANRYISYISSASNLHSHFLTLKMRSAPTFATLCSDRTVNTIEQIISPTGFKFNITTSTCISPSTPDKHATELETRFESVVDKRSASECTSPDCVCGTACKFFEY